MNVQYAIKDDVVYVLEVNPRASRTVPYLSKATGVPLAKVAARVMAGRTLAELGLADDLEVAGVFVKSPVFPFVRFPGVDTILGPEMKSTGEVMGGSSNFGVAFAKAQLAVGQRLPETGTRVHQREQRRQAERAADRARSGGARLPPRRDARHRRVPARARPRRRGDLQGERGPSEHRRRDRQPARSISIINTPLGRESFFDDRAVRRAAMMHEVPCITTLTGASAAVQAIRALRQQGLGVRALQDYYAGRCGAKSVGARILLCDGGRGRREDGDAIHRESEMGPRRRRIQSHSAHRALSRLSAGAASGGFSRKPTFSRNRSLPALAGVRPGAWSPEPGALWIRQRRRGFVKGLAGLGVAGMAGSSALAQGAQPSPTGQRSTGAPRRLPARGEFIVRRGYLLTMDESLGDIPDGDVHVQKRRDPRGRQEPAERRERRCSTGGT